MHQTQAAGPPFYKSLYFQVLIAIVLEVAVGAYIRDNLTLNVIMLLHPFEFIKQWQGGL